MASPMSMLKSSMASMHGDGGLAAGGGLTSPASLAGGGGVFFAPSALDVNSQVQLQDLAKQLSMQMDYNNELLAQLQKLEEQHLAYQRAAAEKQAALRQAMAVADAARNDANDLRRKLAIAQVRRW
jgi:hypothetical protein